MLLKPTDNDSKDTNNTNNTLFRAATRLVFTDPQEQQLKEMISSSAVKNALDEAAVKLNSVAGQLSSSTTPADDPAPPSTSVPRLVVDNGWALSTENPVFSHEDDDDDDDDNNEVITTPRENMIKTTTPRSAPGSAQKEQAETFPQSHPVRRPPTGGGVAAWMRRRRRGGGRGGEQSDSVGVGEEEVYGDDDEEEEGDGRGGLLAREEQYSLVMSLALLVVGAMLIGVAALFLYPTPATGATVVREQVLGVLRHMPLLERLLPPPPTASHHGGLVSVLKGGGVPQQALSFHRKMALDGAGDTAIAVVKTNHKASFHYSHWFSSARFPLIPRSSSSSSLFSLQTIKHALSSSSSHPVVEQVQAWLKVVGAVGVGVGVAVVVVAVVLQVQGAAPIMAILSGGGGGGDGAMVEAAAAVEEEEEVIPHSLPRSSRRRSSAVKNMFDYVIDSEGDDDGEGEVEKKKKETQRTLLPVSSRRRQLH